MGLVSQWELFPILVGSSFQSRFLKNITNPKKCQNGYPYYDMVTGLPSGLGGVRGFAGFTGFLWSLQGFWLRV